MPHDRNSAQSLPALDGDDLLLDHRALPPDRLDLIKGLVPEDWGEEHVVLLKYLALRVPLAIEQGRFVWNGKQIVMRAGHLATADGAAVYLGLGRAEGNRWELEWAGERPNAVEQLLPADLGKWPEIDPRREVVIALDQFHSPPLAGLSPVVQSAAVAGAVEWSLRRGLAVRQQRGASRGYFAPVHLTSREAAPDLAAAIQVQTDRLVVRALIEPHSAYVHARAVAEQRELLPAWLVDAWNLATEPQ